MAARPSAIKRSYLEQLVSDFPDKAIEILMRYCHDPDISTEIFQFLVEAAQTTRQKTSNTSDTTNLNNAHVATTQRSSPVAQRTGSFSSPQRQQSSRNFPSNAEPPSPPKSRSNYSKSQTGKDGREDIVILAMNENGNLEKHPATMKSAPIEYSVIGEHMFSNDRICESNIRVMEHQQISVPRRGVPNTFVKATVSSFADLTWKSATTGASHKTTFYIVSQEHVDIDTLLGSTDSGEDMLETMSSHSQKDPGLNAKDHNSYHHSSNANNSTHSSTRIQPSEFVQSFVDHQRGMRPTPAPAPPRHSHSASADPSSSTHPAVQSPGSDKIRVSCALGLITLKFWLDPDASPQALLLSIQTEFEKKGKAFDRDTASILFHQDKQRSDDDPCDSLSLEEDDLEADWEETVAWIRDKKREKPPHIYATIQFNEG